MLILAILAKGTQTFGEKTSRKRGPGCHPERLAVILSAAQDLCVRRARPFAACMGYHDVSNSYTFLLSTLRRNRSKVGQNSWVSPSVFALLFVSGAVSGTILSFEIGLLWPTFTKFSGAIIGLPFALEGFAFFIEAIFLGLYLYGWERLSPRAHWLCSFPLWIRCKLLPMTLLMTLS